MRRADNLRPTLSGTATPSVKVRAPLRIKGICGPANEDMPLDVQGARREYVDFPFLAIGTLFGSSEHPMSTAAGGEVLLLNPTPAFVRVPSFGPAPQRFPDLMVHVCQDGTTDHPPVIVRPTPYAGVQHLYQSDGCNRGVLLDELPDTF